MLGPVRQPDHLGAVDRQQKMPTKQARRPLFQDEHHPIGQPKRQSPSRQIQTAQAQTEGGWRVWRDCHSSVRVSKRPGTEAVSQTDFRERQKNWQSLSRTELTRGRVVGRDGARDGANRLQGSQAGFPGRCQIQIPGDRMPVIGPDPGQFGRQGKSLFLTVNKEPLSGSPSILRAPVD